jgi:hypothetical protein
MVSIATVVVEKQARMRRSFSMKYMQQAINAINSMMLQGHTVRTASNALNLPRWYYRRWRKLVSKVDQLAFADAAVPSGIIGDTRKVHPGRLSQLAPFQGELLTSVFEMRQQGLPVNTRTLRKEAARVSDEFKTKSTQAKISRCTNSSRKWACRTVFLRTLHRRTTEKLKKSLLIS